MSESAPILSLEDRLLVALAARGDERFGQFIENALVGWRNAGIQFFYISDEQFVEALEYAAFGDDESLHGAEAREHPAHDGASPAGTEAVE